MYETLKAPQNATIRISKAAKVGALRSEGNHLTLNQSTASRRGFVVPVRTNYGTYKPANPTWESRCSCDDRMPPRESVLQAANEFDPETHLVFDIFRVKT